MAEIKPFRAWRYNAEKIEDIPEMFSPLFDVVSQAQLDRLYQIPNNSIHLSVPKSQDIAIQKLVDWKADGGDRSGCCSCYLCVLSDLYFVWGTSDLYP